MIGDKVPSYLVKEIQIMVPETQLLKYLMILWPLNGF